VSVTTRPAVNGVGAASVEYLVELHEAWRQDPDSVPAEWARYFAATVEGPEPGPPRDTLPSQAATAVDMVYKQSRVDSLLWAYRDVGYLYARLNPLVGQYSPDHSYLHQEVSVRYEKLSLQEFGLSEADLDIAFSAGRVMEPSPAPLRVILDAFRETYCGTVGVEFLHIQNKDMRRWLIQRMESTRNRRRLTAEQKRLILEDLIEAEELEHFLHQTFIGQKRFSLEGAEAVITALHSLVDIAKDNGVAEIVLGMTHRGRLTVLNRILNKPIEEIFTEFEDNHRPGMFGGVGDVKYHLGYSTYHRHEDGSSVYITLVPNPSHLEAVSPVVEGKARGIQRRRGDTRERKHVVPVILHGDAAFSGQGLVAETLNLSQLRGYRTGGSVHIVINNQIGFTTSSKDARSTFFPTDVGKMLPVPIFHVNGDDPEAVVHVVDLAFEFRQEFSADVIVNIFCYRRYGHNEGDEPSFTHPRMYALIKDRPSVAALFGAKCDREGVLSAEAQERDREAFRQRLRTALKTARSQPPEPTLKPFQAWDWVGLRSEYSDSPVDTRVDETALRMIADKLSTAPEGFSLHPKLDRILQARRAKLAEDGAVDWAFAEALSFGSLLVEGTPIRLSGQDSARGTFSQRHSVWWDVKTPQPTDFIPLNFLAPTQGKYSIHDSPLSEYSILGFEYGYSTAQPRMLILWEAQFGDFANGAQVIVDNFVASGQTKWHRSSGLVMLLPHGFEGQGPEHSSAHLERYLQLCADNNMQVCNLTTPANYFHVLRRQMKRDFRIPLIVMAPKSLLRHAEAVSPLAELATGAFQEIIDDRPEYTGARRLCLCSGKVYYDLAAHRRETGVDDVALVRLEQLYPLPLPALSDVLGRYRKAREIVWVQEEPRNRGAWSYLHLRWEEHFPDWQLTYAGRREAASPAPGSHRADHQEQADVLAAALGTAAVAGVQRAG
jgi:2-oxoglutarate dehydrogenase E1 component